MDYAPIPRNWFENQYNNHHPQRRSFLLSDKPTLTDRYRIKQLLHSVNHELASAEKVKRVLKSNDKSPDELSGSQEKKITSSFEALLFWQCYYIVSDGDISTEKRGLERDPAIDNIRVRKARAAKPTSCCR